MHPVEPDQESCHSVTIRRAGVAILLPRSCDEGADAARGLLQLLAIGVDQVEGQLLDHELQLFRHRRVFLGWCLIRRFVRRHGRWRLRLNQADDPFLLGTHAGIAVGADQRGDLLDAHLTANDLLKNALGNLLGRLHTSTLACSVSRPCWLLA
jgi:hypothetical protein